MKRLYVFIICMVSLAMISCSDSKDDNGDDPNGGNSGNITLELSTMDIVFEAEGGEKEFHVTCNGDWNITNTSQWCKTNVTNGNGNTTIMVTVNPTELYDDQNTNITVKAGTITKILTVTQKKKDALLLTKDKYDLPTEGGDIIVEVKSNITYSTTIPQEFNWIKQVDSKSRALETRSLNFKIEVNPNTDKREGFIVFKDNASELADTVRVYQAQKDELILTQDTYNVPAEGETINVELKINVDYEVIIPEDAKEWIEQLSSRASRVDKLKFHIEANNESNNRSAKVVIKDKNCDLSDTIFIIQVAQGTYVGDITLATIEDIKKFSRLGYEKVDGNLQIGDGQRIETLVDLNNQLKEVTGDLIIKCFSLSNFDGLYNIRKIAGHLVIGDCNITNFEGLNSLKEIGKDLQLAGHFNNLIDFQGLNNLLTIGGNLNLAGGRDCFEKLESFEGFNNLATIGESFILAAKDSLYGSGYGECYTNAFNKLTSFQGLDNLEKINGSFILKLNMTNDRHGATFTVMGFNSLESFSGLVKLKTIGKDFILYNRGKRTKRECSIDCTNVFKSLRDFKGLEEISVIGGSFQLFNDVDNTRAFMTLNSFGGLDNLREIGENMKITSKGKEQGFNGNYHNSFYGLWESKDLELNNLTRIGGDLCIEGDVSIGISGFKALTSINGSFATINANSRIEGMNNLNTVGKDVDLKISTLNGLTNLEIVNGNCKLIVRENKNNLSLSKLKTVKKDFSITSDASSYLDKLPNLINLTTVGGNFNISTCPITEINSLSNLMQVLGDFSITGCSKLYDFCVLESLLSNYEGTFLIRNCGYNPTKYQILNGQGKPQE